MEVQTVLCKDFMDIQRMAQKSHALNIAASHYGTPRPISFHFSLKAALKLPCAKADVQNEVCFSRTQLTRATALTVLVLARRGCTGSGQAMRHRWVTPQER